jgi:uncharacterized membrane protein
MDAGKWARISLRITLFFVPFIIASLFIIMLFVAMGGDGSRFRILGGAMFLYFFPPLGKESVIPGAIWGVGGASGLLEHFSPGMSITLIAGTIAFVDIISGLFLLWNFDLVEKVPLLGTYIRKFEKKGKGYLSKKPWVERIAFIGVALFVMFPFQGSGAVGASILGRIIGMNKLKVWFAIIIGAIGGCFLIAMISYYLGEVILTTFKESAIYIGVALLVVLLAMTIWSHVKRDEKKGEARQGDETQQKDDDGELTDDGNQEVE